jgi:hypothetical protein
MVEAERQFIDGLLRRIADDRAYTGIWKSIHNNSKEGSS